jgi:DNA polymerase I-like protein with 3'-5' exonuclease and polymerase domains
MTQKSLAFVFSGPPETPVKNTIAKFAPDITSYEVFYLCDTKKDKILKKDITLDFSKLDKFDIVVPVGADSLKHVCKLTNVTKYNGLQVNGKYFPLINPSMVIIKPQTEPLITKALRNIGLAQRGDLKIEKNEKDYRHITSQEEFDKIWPDLEDVLEIVIDTETTGLNYLTSDLICVIFSTRVHQGFCVDIEVIKNNNDRLKDLVKRKKIIFHNAKFDIHMLNEILGWEFVDFEDTMLLHYCLNEAVGTHGLKDLAIEYTDLGDYDTPLNEFKKEFCRKNKILVSDFNFGLIPTDILSEYAMRDGDASMQLYRKFKPLVEKNDKLNNVYQNILIPGVKALVKVERNGGPIDLEFLQALQSEYEGKLKLLMEEIKQDPAVKEFEKANEKEFNPGSVKQLGEVLFTHLKLPPVKLTDTGNFSTDVEVLTELADMHPFPKKILNYRKMMKLKSTYIDSILEVIDKDGRLRSSFNLQGTTSGRLSSSGNLNYQNLPKDEGPGTIKSAFKARPGYVIVQGDLKTAEVYVAAVLSNDKFLQQAFIDKVDFHSYIARQIFKLPCTVDEVKVLYKDHRQWAKAITFGIMYQAGAPTIAEQAKVTKQEAQDFINKYFREAKDLYNFIQRCNNQIEAYQYIYSHFGRKRRLMEAISPNRAIKNHAIRSGVNFVVQSMASDINLLVLCELMDWLDETKQHDDIIPFTIVHDAIVAEVKIEKVREYVNKLDELVSKDRGVSIPDCPIVMEYKLGPNWGEAVEINRRVTVEEVNDILVNKKYIKSDKK